MEKLTIFFCSCFRIFITNKTQSLGRFESTGGRLLDFELLSAESMFYFFISNHIHGAYHHSRYSMHVGWIKDSHVFSWVFT